MSDTEFETATLESLTGSADRKQDRLAAAGVIGAILLEQNDERAVQTARYMTLVWMPAVLQESF